MKIFDKKQLYASESFYMYIFLDMTTLSVSRHYKCVKQRQYYMPVKQYKISKSINPNTHRQEFKLVNNGVVYFIGHFPYNRVPMSRNKYLIHRDSNLGSSSKTCIEFPELVKPLN